MTWASTIAHLPGADLVAQGVRDCEAGLTTTEGLLVQVAAGKLRSMGIPVAPSSVPLPEHQLYEHLRDQNPRTAHGRYNALIRRLVSFERALQKALRQTPPPPDTAYCPT